MIHLPGGWFWLEAGPRFKGPDGYWYMRGYVHFRKWHPGFWLFWLSLWLKGRG